MIPRFLCLVIIALVHTSNAFVIADNKSVIRPALPTRSRRLNPKVLHRSLPTTTLSLLAQDDTTISTVLVAANQISLLRNTDVWVFIVGIIPFGWATVEFWRRIAVGEPFGTTRDSIYIGKENAPLESRGRRVLDRGAFLVAYILFGIAAAAIGITLYSVVTSPPMDPTTIL